MRQGLGRGRGKGYYNIVHLDSYIHSLSAKGIATYPVNLPIRERNVTFSDGTTRQIPFITEPMRPIATLEIPMGNDWVAELKKDGSLSLAYFVNGNVAFINRRGNEKTFVYPELTDQEPKDIKIKGMTVLQGEITTAGGTLDSFQDLLKRDLVQSSRKARDRMNLYPLKFYVFDILMKDGEWVTDEPLEKRHDMIEKLITSNLKDYEVAEQSDKTREFTEEHLKEKGKYEGVVFKRKDSPYISGKTPYWYKKKFVTQADTVVLGYERGKGRRSEIGKINVGIRNPKTGKVEEVARVGTGFTDAQLSDAKRRIDRGEKLFATIEYLNKTRDGNLRNPSWVGIRSDIGLADTHY